MKSHKEFYRHTAITAHTMITAKPDLMPVKPFDCLGAPLGALAFVVAIVVKINCL